jgi:signal transduction histidine kinase
MMLVTACGWSVGELLQLVRHEMRGIVDDLTAILALISASRSRPEEIPELVSAAEGGLRTLSRLADSMRLAIEARLKPSEMTTKENLHDVAKAAIATLAHAARGIEIRLHDNQKVECICDRRMIEFLLTSLLLLLLRALRNDRSGGAIIIAIVEDKEVVKIEMRFHLSTRWRQGGTKDDNLTWKVATTLAKNCGGSIEPNELRRLNQHLKVTLPKFQRDT